MPGYGNVGTFIGGPLSAAGGMGTRVGVAFVTLTTDNTGLLRGFAQATAAASSWQQRMSQVGRGMQTIGGNLSRWVTLPLVAAGGAAVKMASDFETAMQRTVALAGVARQDLDRWRESILRLSHQTAQAPLDLANALYFVASAGLKDNEILPTLTASAQAAAAGMGDAATIGHLLTGVLVGYAKEGYNASQVTDILAAAIREGKAEPEELASNLGTVIEVAAQMGVSFDQVAGAISALTNVNVNAARGATGLRYLLIALQNPTEQAKDMLKEYGLSITDLQERIRSQGLLDTFKFIADTFKINSENAKEAAKGTEAFFTVLGGIRAGHIAASLVGQDFERVANVMQATEDAAKGMGASLDRAFGIMRESPGFKFQQAFNDLRIAAIDAGGDILPIVQNLVSDIGDLAHGFAQLDEPVQQFILRMAGIGAALGPAIYILGSLTRAVGAVGGGLVTASNLAASAWATSGVTQALVPQAHGGAIWQGVGAGMGTASRLGAARGAFFAGLPAGFSVAAWIGAIVSMWTAWNKYQEIGKIVADRTTEMTHALKQGDYTVKELTEATEGAVETTEGWMFKIPVLGGLIRSWAGDQVMGAAQDAVENFDRAFDHMIDTTLRAPGAIREWRGELRDAARAGADLPDIKQFATIVNQMERAGFTANRVQTQVALALLGIGDVRGAISEITKGIDKGDVRGLLRMFADELSNVERKAIRAALKTDGVTAAMEKFFASLKEHRQERHAREKALSELYEQQVGELSGGTFREYGNEYGVETRNILYPQGGAVPKGWTPEQYASVINAATGAAKAGVTELTDAQRESLGVWTETGFKVTATAKQMVTFYEDLRAHQISLEHTQATLTDASAWQDWGDRIVNATKLTADQDAEIGGLVNRIYELGGVIDGVQAHRLSVLIDHGRVNRAIDYLYRLIDKVKNHPAQVQADFTPAENRALKFNDWLYRQKFQVQVDAQINWDRQEFLVGPRRRPAPVEKVHHTGGWVQGDEIARLQGGEYVINRRSAAAIGDSALGALNRMHEGGRAMTMWADDKLARAISLRQVENFWDAVTEVNALNITGRRNADYKMYVDPDKVSKGSDATTYPLTPHKGEIYFRSLKAANWLLATHEMGHALGLWHVSAPQNLMHHNVNNTILRNAQLNAVRWGLGYHEGGLAGDEVPAILQRGEFVIRRSAAQRLGAGVLGALNRMDGASPGFMPDHGFGMPTARDIGAEIEVAMDRVMARHGGNALVAMGLSELATAIERSGSEGGVYMDGYRVGRTLERRELRRRG